MNPSSFATVLAAAFFLFTPVTSASAFHSDGFRKLVEIVPINSATILDDTVLNCTDAAVIKAHLIRTFTDTESARVNSARFLLRAISKNNLIAFKAMIDTDVGIILDPFRKDKELMMSASDFLLTIPKLTVEQAQMKALIQKGQNALPINARATEATVVNADKHLKFIARTGTLSELEAYRATSLDNTTIPVRLFDGSTIYHQAVIGNNINNIKSFSTDKNLKDFINTTWNLNQTHAEEDIDLGNFSKMNPVGWTPLMLAVAMDLYEIVQYFIEKPLGKGEERIPVNKFYKTPDGVDARVLARRLPADIRFPMLDLIKGENPNFKTNTCDAFGTMKRAIEGGATSDCLNFYSWKSEVHDKETIEVAVAKLDSEHLKIVLAESTIAHGNNDIFRSFWNGLKQDTTSNSVALQFKISLLAEYGLRFDLKSQFPDSPTPWYQILSQPTGFRVELLEAMIVSPRLYNMKSIKV